MTDDSATAANQHPSSTHSVTIRDAAGQNANGFDSRACDSALIARAIGGSAARASGDTKDGGGGRRGSAAHWQ
jgi:hypothetical protein